MDTLTKDLSPVCRAYHSAVLPTLATKRVECTQGTCVDILNTIQDWARGGDSSKIFWLNGATGTGKTTIAYTLCEMLQQDNLLAASFFCSRNSADCQDVNRIIPTIAYQLGQYSSLYRQELFEALKSNSGVAQRNADTQFKHLILEPFNKISQEMPKDLIVVIDALDECSDETRTKIVLDMLIQHAASLPIKFFIASRPELTISSSMAPRTGASRSVLRLHDIEKSLVQVDIKLYLTKTLASIDVSPSEIDRLAARAGNLFIFAATIVRYMLPDRGAVDRRQRLQVVLELQPSQKHRSYDDIDNLYTAILANAFDEKIYEETEIAERQQVLRSVICAREPLTMPALAEILGISDEDKLRLMIQPLQSVLHISELNSTVFALHASFHDFMLTKERAGRFYCDGVIQNSYLAECCFGSMSRSLKFNICGLESSYVLDHDISELQTRVEKAISTGLFYSCRYWGDHLTRHLPSPTSLSLLHGFLQKHLLFWMEVLSLKGQIGHGEVVLNQTLTWLQMEGEWTELRDFTYNARNFVTSFASNSTSLSTPHIYVSTLPFTSRQSRVRTTYWPRTQGLMDIESSAMEGSSGSVLANWSVGSCLSSIAQSSDGRRVVSGSGNIVSVWDVSREARVLGPLETHEGPVFSVAFSPDDSRIVSGSQDRTIRVWDAHNGDSVVGPLHGHTSDVYSVAFSPDGTRIASGSKDRTIRMWDAHSGAAVDDPFKGHRKAVRSVAFSPNGEHLASGSDDRTIRVWNWRTGVLALGPIKGHTRSVYCIAYSADGLRLASGSGGSVRVWDMTSGTLLVGPFEVHTFDISSVSFSPNGTQLVSGSSDGTIRVWEVGSGELLAGPFRGHVLATKTVLFSLDGTRILSAGSGDGMICVRDVRHRITGTTKSLGQSDPIYCVAISPDGTRAASGSFGNIIRVWDTHNGALIPSPFKGHTDLVRPVAFSPDGARIVSGSHDNTLRTWDVSTGALLAGPFKGHTDVVSSVAFSPDGSQIVSGSWDRTIRLWDSSTGKSVVGPFEGLTNPVTSIAFSPNGPRIVCGSFDKMVRMWDANKGAALWTSDAHKDWVMCVAFSPDGTRVASGSSSKTILVLDAGNGAVLHGPFTGHTDYVSSVAFSPDGTRVVSGSGDQTVCVWDVESGVVVIGPLKGHNWSVTSVVFSPDGARIISGSADGTIRFWDIAAAIQPDATGFDGWSIDRDGWLTDSQSQRLIWVPSDLRHDFWFPTPSNPLALSVHSTTHIDSDTLLGNRWHECYDPSLESARP